MAAKGSRTTRRSYAQTGNARSATTSARSGQIKSSSTGRVIVRNSPAHRARATSQTVEQLRRSGASPTSIEVAEGAAKSDKPRG